MRNSDFDIPSVFFKILNVYISISSIKSVPDSMYVILYLVNFLQSSLSTAAKGIVNLEPSLRVAYKNIFINTKGGKEE